MDTIILKVDPKYPDMDIIYRAGEVLKSGGLVAFPTETVYGLGADGLNVKACQKIYEAKGRPSDNPLILHISERGQLNRIVSSVPENAEKIMDAFWPGPITIIFPKTSRVPNEITGGFNTVAVRFPENKVARAIISAAGKPIAAPSANSSGRPSPTRASHVEFDLGGKIDMIIDGGPAGVGLESTIIDCTGEAPVILRPGAVTKEMIESVIGSVEVDPAILGEVDKDFVPKAPGMKYTHYSPNAEVILVKGSIENVVSKINSLVSEAQKEGKKVGIMATDETKYLYTGGFILSLGSRNDIEEIASNLFKMLRKFDFNEVDIVYSEVFEQAGEGMAIMNRLNKAAGYKCIEV